MLFLGKEHRRGARQRFEDDPRRFDTGAMHALEYIRKKTTRRRNDVRVHLEAAAGHADGIDDSVLPVHGEKTREGVDDLPIAGNVDNLARIDDALDVGGVDLSVVVRDRNDAAVIDAANVLAGDADDRFLDMDPGHPFGLLGRRFDRLHRLFEIDHHAATHP